MRLRVATESKATGIASTMAEGSILWLNWDYENLRILECLFWPAFFHNKACVDLSPTHSLLGTAILTEKQPGVVDPQNEMTAVSFSSRTAQVLDR